MSQDNLDERRPPLYHFNSSSEVLVVDDRTGSMNQHQDDTRDRSHQDVTGYDDGDSDREDNLYNEDAIINLSLNSPGLTLLKVYLRSTFQWYPSKATSAQKALYFSMRFIIIVFLICVYLSDMGVFHNRSLVEEGLKETVTTAKNIVWSLRMIEMYILGMLYLRKRHLEKMLSKVIINRRYWKKAKKTINKVSFAVFLFAFVLPVISRAVQMNLHTEKAEAFEVSQMALNLSFSILARFLCLPIIVTFIHAVYIIFSQIRLFKKQIQEWPGNMKEEASDRFKDIQNTIRDAERAFQAFLTTHLLLLLVLLSLSVFSYAERFQDESRYQQKYVDAMKLNAAGAIPERSDNFIQISNFSSFHQQQGMTLVLQLPVQLKNTTRRLQKWPVEHTKNLTDVIGTVKVGCAVLADFLEMLILYSLPFVCLAKLHKIIKSLPEVVGKLKFSEQRENGYLFQNKPIMDEILTDLSKGRGIKILGMNLTSVKAVLITLLMPFLTTTFHLLFEHIKVN